MTWPICGVFEARRPIINIFLDCVNADFGLLVTWVLICDRFPGRRSLNAAVDPPFASPTALAALSPGDPVSPRVTGGRQEVPGGGPGGHAVHARTWPPGGRGPCPGRLLPRSSLRQRPLRAACLETPSGAWTSRNGGPDVDQTSARPGIDGEAHDARAAPARSPPARCRRSRNCQRGGLLVGLAAMSRWSGRWSSGQGVPSRADPSSGAAGPMAAGDPRG
jgi:hypothetical protein